MAVRVMFLMLLALAACEDRDRGGLGPRGTALPPPDAATGAPGQPIRR